jgi:hypothetical protein
MKETCYMPPLPAELQQVIDTFNRDLNEREGAAELGITRHVYRERLKQVFKIIGPHARTLVADGAGI